MKHDFEFEGPHFYALCVIVLVPWLSGLYQIAKWVTALL